jgi:hypothetical protein
MQNSQQSRRRSTAVSVTSEVRMSGEAVAARVPDFTRPCHLMSLSQYADVMRCDVTLWERITNLNERAHTEFATCGTMALGETDTPQPRALHPTRSRKDLVLSLKRIAVPKAGFQSPHSHDTK